MTVRRGFGRWRAGNSLLSLKGHAGPVETVAWTIDGDRIITGSHDGSVRVWDSATGGILLVSPGATWPHIAVSPGGRYLARRRRHGADLGSRPRRIGHDTTPLTRWLTAAECVNFPLEDCPSVP